MEPEKKKLMIVMALIGGSDALIFDEPFTSLELTERKKYMSRLLKILNNRESSAIITSSSFWEAAEFDSKLGLTVFSRPLFFFKEFSLMEP